jgi:hypothetical protein
MTNATRPLYRRDVAPHGVGIVCIDEARVTTLLVTIPPIITAALSIAKYRQEQEHE